MRDDFLTREWADHRGAVSETFEKLILSIGRRMRARRLADARVSGAARG